MQRPLTPPSRPYTTEEYFKVAEQHFFVDKSPQSKWALNCVYSGTGCAVGFVMTRDHARQSDPCGTINGLAILRPDIYQIYFTTEQWPMLQDMQEWHDNDNTFGNRELFDKIRAKYTAKS